MNPISASTRVVVMTTHNLERGMELAGSIVILHRGRVVYQASGDEMKRENIRPIYDRYTEEKR
jgi:ABC-type multidrug transport system ATPase subunit